MYVMHCNRRPAAHFKQHPGRWLIGMWGAPNPAAAAPCAPDVGARGGGQATQQLVATLQAERPQLISQIIAAGLQQEGQQRKGQGLSGMVGTARHTQLTSQGLTAGGGRGVVDHERASYQAAQTMRMQECSYHLQQAKRQRTVPMYSPSPSSSSSSANRCGATACLAARRSATSRFSWRSELRKRKEGAGMNKACEMACRADR